MREIYRFRKEEMLEVLPHLGLGNVRYRKRYTASPEVALALLCARLSYPERLKTLIHQFGHCTAWLSTVFDDAILHLSRLFSNMLHWPKCLIYDKALKFAIAISTFEDPHCFWGFIDGTAKFVDLRSERRAVTTRRSSIQATNISISSSIKQLSRPMGFLPV